MLDTPFAEISILLLICAVIGGLFVRLRQPALIAYIVVGVVVGPAFLGLVTAHESIELLAKVGVAVLLFVVGLKLDITHVRHIGPVALATGLGQLAFTIIIGFAIILLLGKGLMEALYVAVALTFSSTIIIVKLLADKREIDTLHGRISIGFLIVQDVAVVIAMMAMSAMRGADDATMIEVIISLVGRIAAAAVLLFLAMRYVLPRVIAMMARSSELLLIFAIAWGTALAAFGAWAGFSHEAGAFLAGFSLASTGYREAINARLTGIRDFLLLFFFIDLGSKLDVSILGDEVFSAIVLSLFVLIGNPLIVMVIMGYMGYRKRTGFLAGLNVAQISEFSIVFVAMGISLGHVGIEALGLTTLVGLLTITLSTYMILYSHPVYNRIAPLLSVFERSYPAREIAVEEQAVIDERPEVVIFGLGRYGRRLLTELHKGGTPVLGIDFDPETVKHLRQKNLPVQFGDGEDDAFVDGLPLSKARWVVTTLPLVDANAGLLHAIRTADFSGKIAGIVRDGAHGEMLLEMGCDRVFNLFEDAADYATGIFASPDTPSPEKKD